MAESGAALDRSKVYRVRNLPGHFDRLSAAELLAEHLSNRCTVSDIHIASLATEIDPWARIPTKTATLTLKSPPLSAQGGASGGEWKFPVRGLAKPLLLDDHFRGLTPLNGVAPFEHQFDCIVLSGLSSHPFGSWQPHGPDKSFMWIRDELSVLFPTIRFILFGYDTVLAPSNSYQTVPDLATTFVDILKTEGWNSPTAKPLLFMAHSLGGVILKQALLMIAGSGDHQLSIANLVKGIIFFGVPSQGMKIPDIMAILGEQPNKDALIKEISSDSEFLPQLEKQFLGISMLRMVKMYWAYETKTSRTVVEHEEGKYSRAGPHTVLVPKASAIGGQAHPGAHFTIQIDENHSDMVKFREGSHRIRIVAKKIEEICGNSSGLGKGPETAGSNFSSADATISTEVMDDVIDWDDKLVLDSLHFPTLDDRREQIEQRAEHTFEWLYEDSSAGLTKWLLRGNGLFWISGKPGSGKSTMMKFISQDQRTVELLHRWKTTDRMVLASFFFHHRGSAIQKSFEGLLQSIVSQILHEKPELMSVLHESTQKKYRERVAAQNLGSLASDICDLLNSYDVNTMDFNRTIAQIIRNQDYPVSLGRFFIDTFGPTEGEKIPSFRIWKLLSGRKSIEFENIHDFTLFIAGLPKYQIRLPEIADWSKLFKSWQAHFNIKFQLQSLFRQAGVVSIEDEYLRSTFEAQINKIARRQKDRLVIRRRIETEPWSLQRLEQALHAICDQRISGMDLVLFLDALDEYDGHKEFICGFLKDLVQETSFPRTTVRIIFSSRPWNIFVTEFSSCPSIKVHEHTKGDIQQYCTAFASGTNRGQLLSPLIHEVVSRSKGVFLWVKLVMQDLAGIITSTRLKDTKHLEDKLHATLNSIPDELDEYYLAIIQRIPSAWLWDTYVVLECIARSPQSLKPETVLDAVSSSTTNRWFEGMSVEQSRYKTDPENPGASCEEFFRQVTGGLVEIQSHTLCREGTGNIFRRVEHIVQFMHQTVKTFVEDARFRFLVLGPDRALMTSENGHSFLAKGLFLNRKDNTTQDGALRLHAREAERTTGLSQYQFFSSFPSHYFKGMTPSHLSFAVSAGLQLYLNEAYQVDMHVFRNSHERLICELVEATRVFLPPEESIKIAQSISSKGYVCSQDSYGWVKVMYFMHRTGVEPNEENPYLRLAAQLLEGIHHASIYVKWRDGAETYSGHILHFSPPDLAERLLRGGASPNVQDIDAHTPLDCAVDSKLVNSFSITYKYRLVLLLGEHGGMLCTTSRTAWERLLRSFEMLGLDIQLLGNLGLPRWSQDSPYYRYYKH